MNTEHTSKKQNITIQYTGKGGKHLGQTLNSKYSQNLEKFLCIHCWGLNTKFKLCPDKDKSNANISSLFSLNTRRESLDGDNGDDYQYDYYKCRNNINCGSSSGFFFFCQVFFPPDLG